MLKLIETLAEFLDSILPRPAPQPVPIPVRVREDRRR